MTEKLYYEDSRMREFSARVMTCEWDEKKKLYGVVLDRTAFFPEGGGQYADPGTLNGTAVEDVKERSGVIFHYVRTPLEPGTEIRGEIDWKERFSRMQQHSGEHLVSGIVHGRFGYENVGFHLGEFYTTLDFNGPLTEQEIRGVEAEANAGVAANLPVQITFPTKEELETLEYRSKKELSGQIRIVTIPGYDVCACCAPHVGFTGEIGGIRLVDFVKYKGGTRVTMLAGFRMLKDALEKENSVKEISHELSAKPNEIAEAVRRLKTEAGHCREKLSRFEMQYLDGKLAELTPGTGDYFLFEEEMDKNAARRFVDSGMRKLSGICGIFLGNGEHGYQYILGSLSVNLRDYLKDFHAGCPGKGGGKPEMVQGTVNASREAILAALAAR